jgi:hypothetical protein
VNAPVRAIATTRIRKILEILEGVLFGEAVVPK